MKEYFEQAVKSTGTPYLDARDKLCSDSSQTLKFIDSCKFTENDWERVITAEIIRGWIENPELYKRAERFAQGKAWTASKRASGHPPVDEMAQKLANLGEAVVPCVIEKIIKDTEPRSEYYYNVLYQAIILLNDQRTYKPLIEIINDRTNDLQIRILATDALVSMKVTEIYDILTTMFINKEENLDYRIEIPGYLMALSPESATTLLLEKVQDIDLPDRLRAATAESLGMAVPEQVKSILETLAVSETKASIRIGAMVALQKVGDENTITLLQNIAQKNLNRQIRETANESVEEIEIRLGIK